MALPFVLGLAVGAGAVYAYKNADKIKETISSSFDKTKENVEDLKETIVETKDCIKKKKESKKEKENTDAKND